MVEIIDVAKMLASGQLKFKSGGIDLLEQIVTIVPVDWVITLQKQLEKKKAENMVYYASKEMGVRWFKNMYDHFKISTEDVIRWGIRILGLAGWGKTRTPEINFKEKFYTVVLNGGAEGKAFGKVGYSVDHFVRGCYASGAKVLFGVECDCIETHCVSDGSPQCDFIAQPTEKFDKDSILVKKQLSLGHTRRLGNKSGARR